MPPRWLRAVGKLFMPRSKRKNNFTYYTGDSDDDGDIDRSGRSSPTPRHIHADWAYRDEGTRVRTSYYNLPASPQKRARSSSLPPSLPSLVTDEPIPSSYDPTAHPGDLDYIYHQLQQLDEASVPRKRTAGDRPLLQWIPEADKYLDELLRLEGRGDFADSQCSCGADASDTVYRCEDCANLQLYCQHCVVSRHAHSPLHRIKQWREGHFSRVSLKSLGLCVQLGHEPSERCINPKAAWGDEFVVLDIFGVHDISVSFCGCERALPHHLQVLRARWYPATSVSPKTAATFRLLESFHILSSQSKVSAYDFYIALARRTSNTGIDPPKDRYPAFLMMSRQWRHLKMMKRGGRGNDPGGIAATGLGECAVECPACPQPGKNLPNTSPPSIDALEPDNIDTLNVNAPPPTSWLRRLYVAIDANFRLKRKKVSNDNVDPSLNHGYAYIVEEKSYKHHLATHDTLPTEQSDHCNNHDAVKLATLKGAPGLAATGVASIDCARHEMKRPCSTGDLQKGERFVNIDYLLWSSLQQNAPSDILASYDIACHIDRKFDSRFEKYGFDISPFTFTWVVPKFHMNAHGEQCRADYNLRYIPFSARDDGEGIERGWSRTNAAALTTKEMGPGARRDTLDDIFSYHNWLKVTYLPAMLLTRIKKAVPERNAQVQAFNQFHAALPEENTRAWKSMVEVWEADRSKPNPFFVNRPTITQAIIKRQLAEEDAKLLADGTAVILHEKFSASAMIIAGIELEGSQRRLKVDVASLSNHATDVQQANMLERQNALRRRLNAWFEVQQLYIPGVVAQRSRLLSDNERASLPQNIPLLLPSSVITLAPCAPELLDQEWRLRHGQAFDALADLRGHLEVRSHLYKFKDRFVRGQRANTRAQSVIKQVDGKITTDVERYRTAYTALSVLSPRLGKSGWQSDLRPLLSTDIRHVTEGEEGQSEGRRTMSWIWGASSSTTAVDNSGQMHDSLQESLRVEWCRARARAARWTEEVELLQEEMRRTIAYHGWARDRWYAKLDKRFDDHPDYREGANAYASRQAAVRASLRAFCLKTWEHVRAWVCLGSMNSEDEEDGVPGLIRVLDDDDDD